MKIRKDKFGQLTSLRFVAAAMIVLHHSAGLFGITVSSVNLGQGVSFFFVLSGFILSHVYRDIVSFKDFIYFWKARIARIWPAYVASLMIGFWLASYQWNTLTGIPNILMLQAWIPISEFYFSYNAVCWSISTEAFFYMCFPFLMTKFTDRYRFILIASIILLIILFAVSDFFKLDTYSDPGLSPKGLLMTQHGLIYISPLSRIFEFILGMYINFLFFQTTNRKKDVDAVQKNYFLLYATIEEIFAFSLCALSMHYSGNIAAYFKTVANGALSLWILHAGSCFSFAFLIFILARGRGKISQILCNPLLVFLGECSFSMYLLHQIFLNFYKLNLVNLNHLSNISAGLLFLIFLMLSSYAMWACIEIPMRQIFMNPEKIYDQFSNIKPKEIATNINRKKAVACAVLFSFIIVIHNLVPSTELAVGEDISLIRPFSTLVESSEINTCIIDFIDGRLINSRPSKVSNKKSVKFVGWACRVDSDSCPKDVFFQFVGGSESYITAVRGQRKDVANALNNQNLIKAGIAATANLSKLKPGKYEINIIQIDGKTSYFCRTNGSFFLD